MSWLPEVQTKLSELIAKDAACTPQAERVLATLRALWPMDAQAPTVTRSAAHGDSIVVTWRDGEDAFLRLTFGPNGTQADYSVTGHEHFPPGGWLGIELRYRFAPAYQGAAPPPPDPDDLNFGDDL